MKPELIALSQGYASDLARHLKQGPRASLRSAQTLGRRAAILGIQSEQLARIHERSMTALRVSGNKVPLAPRGRKFFNAANAFLEKPRSAAREADDRLDQLQKTLGRRTEELAVANRRLQRRVIRRKVREATFAKTGKERRKCLEESLDLQKHLRQLTHRILAVQENERRKIGGELQDEIVQTLLGINLRLLSLKQADRSDIEAFGKEIASARQLVLRSAKAVRKFARELGRHQQRPRL